VLYERVGREVCCTLEQGSKISKRAIVHYPKHEGYHTREICMCCEDIHTFATMCILVQKWNRDYRKF
jgi:hypothetical protein